ncbi:Metalloenzyme, LuxS/M16 peptidase-like protein [Pyronema omphalodes]|nr:Metalloenzyme, LuxS/M16 peptidase-like protein [Pyronema omphalodes]
MTSSNFRIVTQFETDYSPSLITKYESSFTGMTAVVVNRKGPKVNGFFTLATEIHDNSGAPHTLEHLCFMGSENYPYKGMLDKLATRAYSETNAWTATDHTAYTLDTAGWAGFAQILPVYLEHILFPTLKDAGCITEVHHINGEGEDAGVVYSEMQGVQNTQESLMNEAANKLLYQEGIGFRYETGGMMDALRELTADRIRQFHKEMYRPQNLCVIIIGEVDEKELVTILDKFEKEHFSADYQLDTKWKRPWVDSEKVIPLTESKVATVEFPDTDESTGEIMVAFLGPDCMDPVSATAVEVMCNYLAGSSVSVLEKALVEIEDPWATSVRFYNEDRPNTVLWIQLTAVSTGKLEAAKEKLLEVLKDTVAPENKLNFSYITDLIHRDRRQTKFYAETSGHSFSTPIITDHLFGKRDGSQLRKDLENLNAYDELLEWDEAKWKDFIRKNLVDNHHVAILGRPSAALKASLEATEKQRIEDRVAKLGEKGLKELQQKLDNAKAENDKEIPPQEISKFVVPGVDSIHFIDTNTARAGLALKSDGRPDNEHQRFVEKDAGANNIPLYLHYESVPTEFVHVNLVINTAGVPEILRPLLPIYTEMFFDTPVTKDGKRVEYEQVVEQLERETVSLSINSGSYLDLPEAIRIRLQVEPEKYETAIQWLHTLLWDNIFDPKRIAITVSKLRSDIPDEKRQGKSMVYSVKNMIELHSQSIGKAKNTLVKAKYLKKVETLLKSDPDAVVKQFEQFREGLTQLKNIRVLTIADLTRLKNPVSSWNSFVKNKRFDGQISPLDRRLDRLNEVGRNPSNSCHIVELPAIDSTFSTHTGKGPINFDDEQLPALLLVLAYLTATEGPLWNAARGSGLAYGVGLNRAMQSGQLVFDVYRSPDAFKAFSAVKKVLRAVSSIVVSFADNEPNLSGAGTASFIRQVVNGLPKDFNSQLLQKIKNTTVKDMKKALHDYVLPCFEPATSNVVVITSLAKADEIEKQFKDAGFNPDRKNLKEYEDDYGYGAKYGVPEDEDEEDDDELDEEGETGDEDDEEESEEED